jgi:hypothetical protein
VEFSLKPLRYGGVRWLRFNTNREPKWEDDRFWLRVDNVPPFLEEELMPPPEILTSRVEFRYEESFASWGNVAFLLGESVDNFVGKPKKVAPIVESIAPPSLPAEERLRKLYAYVQEFRNLSFEHRATDETAREKLKDNDSAEEVLKRRYGTAREINLTFLALARAAGFEANELWLATRNHRIFNTSIVSFGQLDAWVIEVRLGDREWYLDPATKYCPFGLLPWEETGSGGIRAGKAGTVSAKTPQPTIADASTERNGTLELDADRTLTGELEIVFRGHEALSRRLNAHGADDAERSRELLEDLKAWFPASATVSVKQVENWTTSSEPLKVYLTLTVPDFASPAGSRLLLPASLFVPAWNSLFQNEYRIHPMYFSYPFRETDRVQIRLPRGYRVEGLPAALNEKGDFGAYTVSFASAAEDRIRIDRQLDLLGYYFRPETYRTMRAFFGTVRNGDGQKLVLAKNN